MIAGLLSRGLLLAARDKSRACTEPRIADKRSTMIRSAVPIGGGIFYEAA